MPKNHVHSQHFVSSRHFAAARCPTAFLEGWTISGPRRLHPAARGPRPSFNRRQQSVSRSQLGRPPCLPPSLSPIALLSLPTKSIARRGGGENRQNTMEWWSTCQLCKQSTLNNLSCAQYPVSAAPFFFFFSCIDSTQPNNKEFSFSRRQFCCTSFTVVDRGGTALSLSLSSVCLCVCFCVRFLFSFFLFFFVKIADSHHIWFID